MKMLSLSEVKMKLSALVDAVSSTDEEITITKNGHPVAVLVSPDVFEGWKETQAIMSDADLVKEIKKGLKALRILPANQHEGKSLRDDLEGLKSYRVGRFRIIYRVSAKKYIGVVAIGPRKNIYEETLSVLKKEAKKN